ncbi:MAG TPA: DUF5814 domain-containing protein [Methanocorpusculum sp.]|nr:DUF5814 domain-containing protein [Methanocorpusculum sp.]HJJ91142.1 DUF5814 domain-containing protein [Methanocorpusculum sp.]HJK00685.1 DUF5814 domain-containing protein [Methanocorpusculum sp.]HJK02338.1 DUF5814 domain-containing protein [Methanocorpusculum sp.]
MIVDRARFRYINKLQRVAGCRLPEGAFHPINMELIMGSLNIDCLDSLTRDMLLHFYKDFLDCNCRDSPLCGCPERKFVITVLELREQGFDHRDIHIYLREEYGIDLFPADILSFLEESVHLLEIIRSVSDLAGRKALSRISSKHIHQISR